MYYNSIKYDWKSVYESTCIIIIQLSMTGNQSMDLHIIMTGNQSMNLQLSMTGNQSMYLS